MIRSTALIIALSMLPPTAARADGNSGAADPELEFGAITTYPSEAQARAACPQDAVVWADRYAGYFYRPGETQYGATSHGAYACLHVALGSNYWDTSPLSSMAGGHGPGRVFPYNPLPQPSFGS